jgi:hypothetical protein
MILARAVMRDKINYNNIMNVKKSEEETNKG